MRFSQNMFFEMLSVDTVINETETFCVKYILSVFLCYQRKENKN